jgi:type I restriction enzyme R subunit
MKSTEMCVVISQEQGEIEYFQKHNIDIIPHRKKMMDRELDKEFKDENNPFRVVFVCAMWLTGFDCPSLSVLYLDKPLQAHTLMQTIARANRVNDGKENGLIEDYIGIVTALEKALVDYTTSGKGNAGGGHKVTIDRDKLVAAIYEDAALAIEYLKLHGFEINDLINSKGFARIKMIQTGANCVAAPDEVKKEFCTKAGEFFRLYKYAVRSEITQELKEQHDALEAIYRQLTKAKPPVDVDDIMKGLEEIVNEYISTEETPDDAKEPNATIDISNIDFDKLSIEFAKIKNQKLVINDISQLVAQRLAAMLKTNPNRIDFYKHYLEVIEEYNRSQDKAVIEQVFNELLQTVNDMNGEQKRYVREGFDNDEELTIYDMLFKDNLSKQDIKKIKELSKTLLKKIKDLLAEMDSPFDKEATIATIQNEIRNTLWAELPDNCMNDFDKYRQSIFDYLKSVYSAA